MGRLETAPSRLHNLFIGKLLPRGQVSKAGLDFSVFFAARAETDGLSLLPDLPLGPGEGKVGKGETEIASRDAPQAEEERARKWPAVHLDDLPLHLSGKGQEGRPGESADQDPEEELLSAQGEGEELSRAQAGSRVELVVPDHRLP